MRLKDYPLIGFTILFIAGIISAKYFSVSLYLFGGIFLASLIWFFISKNNKELVLLPLALLVVIAGNLISTVNKAEYNFLPPNLYKQKDFTAFGKVTDVELKKEDQIQFYITTDSLLLKNSSVKKSINLLCKIRDGKKKLEGIYSRLKPGNYISIKGTYAKGRERRNPGEFDFNAYLNAEGITGVLSAYEASDVKIISSDADNFKAAIFDIRKSLDDFISKEHLHETASLLKGLLLADRSGIDYETKVQFVNSGVIHVLAVSGLHVGFIAIVFHFLFGRFNIYLRHSLTILGLICFMLITGMPPSVVRATIMASVILISMMLNRNSNLINSLSIAALIILIVKPDEIYSPGFQLSFSAVAAIALFYPPLQKFIYSLRINSQIINWLLLFFAVSLSAQIGTLPFTLTYFGKLSVIALFVNIIVIPAIAVIVGIAMITVFFSFFLPFAVSHFAFANDILTYSLFKIVNWSGSLDFSFIRINNFSIADALIFYSALGLIFYLFRISKRFSIKIAAAVLLSISVIIFSSLDDKELLKENELNVLVIDVGQGDAILIKFPNGKTALIDAGEAAFYFDNGERVVAPLLDHLGIKQVDYGFISHLDADHYGGFISLIEKGRIKKIVKPQFDSTLQKDIRLENFLRKKNVPFEYYTRSAKTFGGVKLYILNDEKYQNKFSTNDRSGVLKLVYGKTSFLFPGDVEKAAENFYSNKYRDYLKADVLKVAHHGSITSSIPQFIHYVKPSISLISAGIQNKFNHPSSIVLNRLNAAGSKIIRTDAEGAILLCSNGDYIYKLDWREFY